MINKISSGSVELDYFIGGGYEAEVLTTIFGPAGSGKTNLCLLAMANFSSKKKIVYIDTEGSFSLERFKQITPDYKDFMSRIIFFKPTNFEEQKKIFLDLKKVIDDVGLIVFDSVAMLYRLEIGRNNDVYNVNKDLSVQLSYLSEIARKKKIPVLITNQAYADFENKNKVKMVGGDILKYSSKCLIELQNGEGFKRVILRKHRSLPDGKELFFKIINIGIEKFNPQ